MNDVVVADRTAAEALGQFTANLRLSDVPAPVWTKAQHHLLDSLGVMLVNCPAEFAQAMHAMVVEMGGQEEATVVGFGTRLPAGLAAMVNGGLARGQDYDDTSAESITHCGGIVAATALAMAERQHASGAQLIAALIAGYEVSIRIGAAAPGVFYTLGYHTTSLASAFGAAAVAGKLLGLDSQQQSNAFGIVGSQSSGLAEFHNGISWVKWLEAGWAAHSGIVAALLAQQGFAGPSTVLEGKLGFFRTHLGSHPFDEARLTRDLGSDWGLSRVSLKLYPCCHHLHGPLDALLALRAEHHLRLEDVREIACYLPKESVPQVCEPRELKANPPNGYAGQFSAAYSLAAAMVEGHALRSAYADDKIRDPRILDLAGRVNYIVDKDTTFPAAYGGAVDILLADGRRFHRRVPYCKGSPENPASLGDVVSKFETNVKGVLHPEAAAQLAEIVPRIDAMDDLGQVSGLIGQRVSK